MTHQKAPITDCKKQKILDKVSGRTDFHAKASMHTGNSIFYIGVKNVHGDGCTFLISSTYDYWNTPNSFLYKFQPICDVILPDLPTDEDEENYIKDLFIFYAL